MCFTTLSLNTLIFFVEKIEKIFFATKHTGVCEILTFEILTKR